MNRRFVGAPRRAERGERGFALVLAMFAIVLISAVVTGGFFLSSQQFRVGQASLRANAALYSAEAGLATTLDDWDPPRAERLAPGATIPFTAGTLASGDTYRTWLTRLDGDTSDPVAYYLVRSVGRSHSAHGGRRALGLTLATRRPIGLCCVAALEARGNLVIGEAGRVSGMDADAAAPCGTSGVTGLRLQADARLDTSPDATIAGDPPSERHELTSGEMLVRGDLDYDRMVRLADVRFAGGTELAGTRPQLDGGGECARDVATNWGAPGEPDHPCFDFFPVVHVAGDLTIDSPAEGQGVLLVDGDLRMDGGYTFYGVVVVRGALRLAGGARLRGGAVIVDEGNVGSEVGPGSAVDWGSCAVSRAGRLSQLNAPHPLARRAWLELLN